MDEPPRLQLAPGPAGWTEVRWPPRYKAYLRFALNADVKTVRIVDLRLPKPTVEALRSLPLARIENGANANGAFMIGFAAQRLAPEPADVPGYFATAKQTHDKHRTSGRFVLERPHGRFLDDAFYVNVARAYRDAAALGLRPRATIAADANVAPDTVARWIGEARKRKFLPKGRPGRVTAGLDDETLAKLKEAK